MIVPNEIFKKNIQFSLYGRSGSIIRTKNKNINNQLHQVGWSSYFKDGVYRLNPPTLNLVDIVDVEKAYQYQNIVFNFTLYKYLKILSKQNELEKYCCNVIERNKIAFKDFSFHISISPILEYAIKVEGIDNRIYKLKPYLIKYLLEDEKFIKIYRQNLKLLKKCQTIKTQKVSKENLELQQKYLKEYNIFNWNLEDRKHKVDFEEVPLEKFDYIIFILNGCFKILPYFDLKKYKDKIVFWEVHIDETKGINKFQNIDKLKNKSVLVVDSVYSGKTLLYIKEKVKSVTDNVQLLGIFPKSDNVANICDYSLILNKVIKKKENGIIVEKEILSILGGENARYTDKI